MEPEGGHKKVDDEEGGKRAYSHEGEHGRWGRR